MAETEKKRMKTRAGLMAFLRTPTPPLTSLRLASPKRSLFNLVVFGHFYDPSRFQGNEMQLTQSRLQDGANSETINGRKRKKNSLFENSLLE